MATFVFLTNLMLNFSNILLSEELTLFESHQCLSQIITNCQMNIISHFIFVYVALIFCVF
jgi:hypothetical protein